MADRPAIAPEREIRSRIAKLPRSRDGCRTCRIRRIKCDQSKPDCFKCSSTGRWCEWFDKARDANTLGSHRTPALSVRVARVKHAPVAQSQILESTRSKQQISLVSPPSSYVTPEQRRSLHYFCQRTAPQLSGLFSTRFWGYDVLQASEHNATLRHAIAALGSLHERFEQSDPTVLRTNQDLVQGGFALQQYVQSISLLAKPDDGSLRTEVDVYLVACLLFASFEMLRGHHGSAIQHIHCGVRILAEISEGLPGSKKHVAIRPKCPLVPLESLAIIFTRLDAQAQQILGFSVFPEGIAKLWQVPGESFCDEIPDTFASMEAARNSFEFVAAEMNAVLVDGPDAGTKRAQPKIMTPELDQQRRRVLNHYENWNRALDRTLADQNSSISFSVQNLRAAQLLRLLATLGIIALRCAGSTGEMIYDDFTAEYRYAVDLAATVVDYDMELDGRGQSTKSFRPHFQMDTGIVVAMFETMRKCRDPIIRRRAVSLLENHPWQEGLWDGILVSRCGRVLLEIEEGEGGSNLVDGVVPEWARVSEVHAHFDREMKCGLLRLGQASRGSLGEPVYTSHVFQW